VTAVAAEALEMIERYEATCLGRDYPPTEIDGRPVFPSREEAGLDAGAKKLRHRFHRTPAGVVYRTDTVWARDPSDPDGEEVLVIRRRPPEGWPVGYFSDDSGEERALEYDPEDCAAVRTACSIHNRPAARRARRPVCNSETSKP
jgi:hypothetical protein